MGIKNFLLTSNCTPVPAEVVSAIHVFCETKVSYFDHSMAINPVYVKCFQSLVHIHNCKSHTGRTPQYKRKDSFCSIMTLKRGIGIPTVDTCT